MRRLCIFALAASLLAVLPLALGGDRAAAIFSCGMFDGKFQCRASQGGATHGKSAIPGERPSPRRGARVARWDSDAAVTTRADAIAALDVLALGDDAELHPQMVSALRAYLEVV